MEPHTRRPVDRRLAIGALLSVLIVCLIGVYYAGDRGPRRLDKLMDDVINGWLGDRLDLQRVLLIPTQPYVVLPVIALITTACLLGRRGRDAALAALGPAVAVSLNTGVLKPLFDRQNEGILAYPSGHTVGLVSTLAVLAVLARPGLATALVIAVGAALLAAGGIGLVGLGYHYFTDVVGGAFFAVAVVLVLRLAISRASRRPPSREPSTG